jgi:hypothetical protein
VSSLEPLDLLCVDLQAGLAQQLVREQAAAHSDPAMNAPHGQLDAFHP